MGCNARKDAVLTCAAALGNVLERNGIKVSVSDGIAAALDVYGD